MDSPDGVKRTLPEIVTLEPVKLLNGNSTKENIPPPASVETSSIQIGFLIDKQCQATPKKRFLYEDPVTPNTNFKLLTSLAATLDYANCTASKSKGEDNSTEDVTFDNQTCEDSEGIIFHPPSRKEKSLAIICTRFLDIFPLYPATSAGSIVVSLDEVSAKLGIERRRLYDIVNVFESIEMLSKLAKNRYLWYGKTNLVNALQKMKRAALNENVQEKLQYVLDSEENLPLSKQSCILEDVKDFNKKFEFHKSSSTTPEIHRYPSPLPELRKEKSLAIMSQKFLMLFLVTPTKIISLGVAAKVLNGFQSNERGAQIKTQIRRLYDIANVLSSIGLIIKEVTIGQNGRKPAFKYIGPDLADETEMPSKESQKQSHRINFEKLKPKSLVRHSSFQEMCAVAEMERKKIFLDELPNSAPPFQKNFRSVDLTPEKISFSDLKFNFKPKEVSPSSHSNLSCNLKDLQTLPLLQNYQSGSLNVENKKPQPQMRSISLPRQSSLQLINVPRQILNANGPYYILNPSTKEVMKSPTPMGTVLLISPISVNNSVKEVKSEKVPEKKVPASQTLQLSAEQRDTILKSLNLSLSDGQIAAIQLEGSSQSANSEIKPRCNLLKIIEKHEQITTSANDLKNLITLSHQQTYANNVESEPLIPFDTRNPSSRFDSPVNLPSGLVTPIHSASSDDSLISNCENVPEKIENPAGATELHFRQEHFVQSSPPDSKREIKTYSKSGMLSLLKPLTKGEKRKSDMLMENCKNNVPLKDIQNLYSTCNSYSSDGINAEVSEILNGRVVDGNSNHGKPYLFDEKTILSPLKKPKGAVIAELLTPTSFPTSPYTVHDAYFEFSKMPFGMSK